ncbi:MAG: hypothetical protein RL291_2072 [Pseudomonadota bacterium]|jgi:peptidoglycan hydrolase-like protein with peptidoglycan-binding domain
MAGALAVTTLSVGVSAVTWAQQQTPTTTERQPVDPQEEAFWNLVKDTQNPVELETFLQRFPNSTYAAQARARLEVLRRQTSNATPTMPAAKKGETTPGRSAPAPEPAPEQRTATPAPAPSFLTTPQRISEAKERLYALGYNVPNFEGVLDDETREAIRRFQTNLRFPATGTLSQNEFEALLIAEPPRVWGAVAFSWTGSSGAVWQRPTRRMAEDEAVKLCNDSGGQDCRTLAVHSTLCAAFAQSPGPDPAQPGGATLAPTARQGIAATRETALNDCRARARNPESCTLRNAFCADGSHSR